MTALTIVAVLEVLMLVYSVVNSPMYGPYLWNYRIFYISLLTIALVYMILHNFVKRDIEHRYRILNYANPLCAVFFFAWSVGITYSDLLLANIWDPTVFMTFSLVVPLSFFLFPKVYAVIVILANALMIYITLKASSTIGPLINLSIFFIFQFVLGISFLRLKTKLAERIVVEHENADFDVMTGFSNRRVYEEDMKRFLVEPLPENFCYIAFDINGLKDVNDHFGHDAGDRTIIGAAQHIGQCFGDRGTLYRIGGDEFVALITATREELNGLLVSFEASMNDWSDSSKSKLSMSYGCICSAEHPGSNITALAKMADEQMYKAKVKYYNTKGTDRRRYIPKESG